MISKECLGISLFCIVCSCSSNGQANSNRLDRSTIEANLEDTKDQSKKENKPTKKDEEKEKIRKKLEEAEKDLEKIQKDLKKLE